MAVAAFKSTTRRTCNVRGVEVEAPGTPGSRTTSPTRRSLSRNTSPVRRGTSVGPTQSRRSTLSPSRRSASRGPSPSRRSTLSPSRRSVSRGPSPSQRSVSRGPSPSRRSVSRGPSPSRRGPPSTPRTQTRPTSPSKRRQSTSTSRPTSPQKSSKPSGRLHRRTLSFADLSLSSYVSDASTVAGECQSQDRAGVARYLPSDSESEAEPRYLRKLERTSSRRDGSDTEGVHSSRSISRRSGGQRAGNMRRASTSQIELRRSLSHLELSNSSTPAYYQKPKAVVVEDCLPRDDCEVQVEEKTIEEKTIQEVHTQTKLQTLCYNCLYDVSSSADMASDYVSPNGVKLKVLGNSREAPSGDLDFVTLYNARCSEVQRAISEAHFELEQVTEPDVRSEYAHKLDESEKKVSELWSQYATEERKCLHLVKLVKEIRENSPAQREENLKPQRSLHLDVDDTDFIRQSLDEEAVRYFEECVIIANFDAAVTDDISLSTEKEDQSMDDEMLLCEVSRLTQSPESQEDQPGRPKEILPLDNEGMLLPWLDWEPEVDLGRKERIEKAVGNFKEWKSAWARNSVEWGRSSNRERGKDEGAVNVDEFLFERTRLQPRIASGRIVVCGGKRLTWYAPSGKHSLE